MGLDMYLEAERYVSDYTNSSDAKRKAMFEDILRASGMPREMVAENSPSLTVRIKVGYWRKANQIHGWFVREVQGGEDDCHSHNVYRDKLTALRNLCAQVLETRNHALLEPVGGFFFGSTDIDEWYWSDIASTIETTDRCLRLPPEWDFYYRASW